jgi:biopolymer transport protein ExbD
MQTNRGSDDSLMAELNVTPLVDVMLVLLVIFIVTAPLIVPQSLKVNLPRTQSIAQQDQAKNGVLIIDAAGAMTFEGAPMNQAQLASVLKERGADEKFQLQVHSDKAVPYGVVAEIMALAQANGVSRLSFVTLSAGK